MAITADEINAILSEWRTRNTETYVGMRYVPVFEGVWDGTLEYEPLTIVQSDGSAYVSKAYVPVGVQVTDSTFWMPWGDFAAGVVTLDTLSSEVASAYVRTFDTVAQMQAAADLAAGMTCHTNGFHASGDGGAAYYTVSASGTANGMDVLALQGGLYASEVNISLSNAAIDEITDGDTPSSDGFVDETGLAHFWDNTKSYVDNLVNNYRNKKAIFIGDSWAAGYNGTGTNYGYIDYIISDSFFGEVERYQKGGSGFITSADDISFSTLADNAISENTTADVVFVLGGVNDLSTGNISTVSSAVTALCNKLKAAFPSALICVSPNIITNPSYLQCQILSSVSMGAIKAGCATFPYAVWSFIGSGYFTSDRYHMTQDGYRLLAYQIEHLLTTGKYINFSVNRYISSELTLGSGVTLDQCVFAINGFKRRLFVQINIPNGMASGSTLFTVPKQYLPINNYVSGAFPRMKQVWTPLSPISWGSASIENMNNKDVQIDASGNVLASYVNSGSSLNNQYYIEWDVRYPFGTFFGNVFPVGNSYADYLA